MYKYLYGYNFWKIGWVPFLPTRMKETEQSRFAMLNCFEEKSSLSKLRSCDLNSDDQRKMKKTKRSKCWTVHCWVEK